MYRTILDATDLTEDSEPAMRAAFEVAGAFDATVIVVHAAGAGAGHDALEQARAALHAQVQRVRESARLARESASRRPTVREVVLAGDPPLSILGAAEQHRADMIVLGTHGRIGRLRGLVGSVAEQVVRLAPCPVLTVRGPG